MSQTDVSIGSLPERESTSRRAAPRLSTKGLSRLLAIMCLVPVVTIAALWYYLPPVFEGKLECSVSPAGLPPLEMYQVPYRDRTPVEGASIIVRNASSETWTHINVVINTYYQIYDIDPLQAGQEREYFLNRFVSRTGARFEVRYNPLKTVRVYARRPAGDRATCWIDFGTSQ